MRKASSRSTKRRPPGRPSTLQSRPPRARTASAGQALPSPGEGKRGEDGHLATGLTHPQFVVLTMLKAYPGLSGADCARMALLTPQTVNVIIGNLERDGAIRRAPHPVHGRMLQWTLTARGLALLAKARRGANALEQRLAAGLGKRDVATIRRWLARIAAEFHPD
jgi:DNA-binding MarR family transcriptional regulator